MPGPQGARRSISPALLGPRAYPLALSELSAQAQSLKRLSHRQARQVSTGSCQPGTARTVSWLGTISPGCLLIIRKVGTGASLDTQAAGNDLELSGAAGTWETAN